MYKRQEFLLYIFQEIDEILLLTFDHRSIGFERPHLPNLSERFYWDGGNSRSIERTICIRTGPIDTTGTKFLLMSSIVCHDFQPIGSIQKRKVLLLAFLLSIHQAIDRDGKTWIRMISVALYCPNGRSSPLMIIQNKTQTINENYRDKTMGRSKNSRRMDDPTLSTSYLLY